MGPSVRQGGRGEAARASRSAASPAASPSANDKTPDAAAVAAAVMVGMGAAGDRSHSVARERLREGLTCHASRGLLSTLVEVERVLQAISAPPGPAPGAPPAASALLHGATLDPIVSAKQRPGGGHAPATSRHPRKRVAAEGPGAVPAAWEGCGTGVGSPGVGMGVGDGLEGTPPTATGSTLRHGWGEGEGRRDGAGKTPATCVVKRARLGDLTGAGVGLGG